jgi:hypothetical protein
MPFEAQMRQVLQAYSGGRLRNCSGMVGLKVMAHKGLTPLSGSGPTGGHRGLTGEVLEVRTSDLSGRSSAPIVRTLKSPYY